MKRLAKSSLSEVFLEDHRKMTRTIQDLVTHLTDGSVEAACRVADELDRIAGPHIEFEERVLYPKVGKVRGRDLERNLLLEHSETRSALVRLLEADRTQMQEDAFRTNLLHDFQSGLRHAETCGTLISHLDELTTDEQDAALNQLKKLKQEGRRWTGLTSE